MIMKTFEKDKFELSSLNKSLLSIINILSLINTKLWGWNNMMGNLPGNIINDLVCPWDIEHDPEVEPGRVPRL